jgi:hypothetical protein
MDNGWQTFGIEDSHRLSTFFGMKNRQASVEAALGPERIRYRIDFEAMQMSDLQKGVVYSMRRIERETVGAIDKSITSSRATITMSRIEPISEDIEESTEAEAESFTPVPPRSEESVGVSATGN